MTALLEASNYHQTRRHYATEMAPKWKGKAGFPLCNNPGMPTEIYDQAYQDAASRMWGHLAKTIGELPLCKNCEKQAAKHGLEVPQ